MYKSFTIAVVFCLFALSAAQLRAEAFIDFPDDFVRETMRQARPMMKDVQINQQPIGEESAQELSDPLLSAPQGEEAMVRGVISLMAQRCALDWKNASFIPFMAEKQAEGYSPKEAAFAGLLHNFSMKVMAEKIGNEACTAEDKRRVDSFLYH